MAHIDYPNVIAEPPEQLRELEKHHRYTHLFQRVRMLRLLKSGENVATTLARQPTLWATAGVTVPEVVGRAYTKEGGVGELLVSRVAERGRQELVSDQAWEEFEEAMKEGKIST